MDLYQLEYFQAVASTGSIVKAAQNLNLAPSSVSKAVSKLEDELGVSLLHRTGNRVALTAAGKELLPYITTVLSDALGLRIAAQRTFSTNSPVKIAASEAAIQVFESLFVHELVNETIEFMQCQGSEASALLLRDEITGFISTSRHKFEDCVDMRLFQEEIHLLVPSGHRFFNRNEVRFSELTNQDIAVYLYQDRLFSPLFDALRQNDIIVRKHTAHSADTFRYMIQSSHYLAFSSALQDLLPLSNIIYRKIPVTDAPPQFGRWTYYMTFRKDSALALDLFKMCLVNIRYCLTGAKNPF